MPQAWIEKIPGSQKLAALQDSVSEQGQKLKFGLEKRQQFALGQLRDSTRAQVLKFGALTLDSASNLVNGVPLAPAGLIKKGATSLRESSEGVLRPPIEDYDELNVGQVLEALEGLSLWELEKVRKWESARKNRVTVLREVHSRLGLEEL